MVGALAHIRFVPLGGLRFPLLLVFFAAIPGLLLLFTFQDGMIWQGDSRAYISASDDLLAGQLPEKFDGWPIGYPVLLALTALVSGSSVSAAAISAVVGGGLLVLATYSLIKEVSGKRVLALFASAFIAVSPGLLETGWIPQSDLWFAVSCTASLIPLAKALNTDRNMARWLLLGALLTTTATLFRYSGVALLPAVAAASLLAPAGAASLRLLRTVSVTLLAGLGYGLNVLWHISIGLGWSGIDRGGVVDRSAADVIPEVLIGLGRLVVPARFNSLVLVAGLLFVAVVASALIVALRSSSRAVVPASIFIVGFWASFGIAMLDWLPQTQAARYALAAQPALLACLMFLIRNSTSPTEVSRGRWLLWRVLILGAVLLQLGRTAVLLSNRPEASWLPPTL